MTCKQAANRLGCDPSCVRGLIRSGRLPAVRMQMPTGQFIYDISPENVAKEAERYRTEKQKTRRGRPRKYARRTEQ